MLEESSEGRVVYTRVGDPFVIERALRENAVLAGEPNGHYCFPGFTSYNSGLFFGCLLAGMANQIPEARSALPRFFVEKKVFQEASPGVKIQEVKKKVLKEFPVVSTEDGVKFLAGEATVLIRPSGTSPVIRVVVESREKALAEKTLKELEKKFF
jgi:phosphoglucosamine mutase